MICEIAGLGVDVPDIGDLPARCRAYEAKRSPDIMLDPGKMMPDHWKNLTPEENYYLESGFMFYRRLLAYDGLMLHSSAAVVDGKAYLFSGPCGVGKSTHTAKYCRTFPGAYIINDDKPALRQMDGRWYVFGTPWCGKDGINVNACVPLAGICFLRRGETKLKRLTPVDAALHLLSETCGRGIPRYIAPLMKSVDYLVREIPIFELTSQAEPGVERLTYEAMSAAASGKGRNLEHET